jgi:V/A-type H+/Na+-transporting ATPase subunit I
MIVPMNKYAFLVHHGQYQWFVDELKDLGVVHVVESDREPTHVMQEQFRLVNDVAKTVKLLQAYGVKGDTASVSSEMPRDGALLHQHIKALLHELEQAVHQMHVLDKEKRQLLPWGSFSKQTIEQLKNSGMVIRFLYAQSNILIPTGRKPIIYFVFQSLARLCTLW